MNDTAEFGKLRTFFWPIHSHELRKFLPMGMMMFFILFNYSILRNSKDALVVSAGGASVIPFLKGYVVFPASILFVMVYSKLVDWFSKEKVFYIVVSFFLTFFALFALLIYPNKELFHPNAETITALKASYPNLKHFISIYGTWSYSIYYVLSELWGSSMISLLFWQFANEITRTTEAKRFYAMFGMIANFSLIFAGLYVKTSYQISSSFASLEGDAWAYALLMLATSVVISGFLVMYCYRFMTAKVLTDKRYFDPKEEKKPKKKKQKLSALESFKILAGSPYLLMIALLVLCYGISINLIELVWKAQLKQQFPNPNDYNNFMGNLSIGTGICTILTILFSKGVLQKFGWFYGAVVTPLMILVTGVGFFGFVFFAEYMSPVAAMVGLSSLMMAVWLGTIQNILSKGVKYGLFDPTKEMAYIPLDSESKTKGKAAVDVLGGRLGKASGGYISSILLLVTAGSVADIAPLLCVAVILTIVVWLFAVKRLNGMYKSKLDEVNNG